MIAKRFVVFKLFQFFGSDYIPNTDTGSFPVLIKQFARHLYQSDSPANQL